MPEPELKFGLDKKTIAKIQQVFEKYPQIEEVIIFGSRAKGNYKTGSDVDLALKGSALNLKIINRINNELDDLLLPYTFDLIDLSSISNTELLEHIKRVGKSF